MTNIAKAPRPQKETVGASGHSRSHAVVTLSHRGSLAESPSRQQSQEKGCSQVNRGISHRVALAVNDMREHGQAKQREDDQHGGCTPRHGPTPPDRTATTREHENL